MRTVCCARFVPRDGSSERIGKQAASGGEDFVLLGDDQIGDLGSRIQSADKPYKNKYSKDGAQQPGSLTAPMDVAADQRTKNEHYTFTAQTTHAFMKIHENVTICGKPMHT